jgi:hypothetical protein
MFANCVDKKAAKISEIKISALAFGKKSYPRTRQYVGSTLL